MRTLKILFYSFLRLLRLIPKDRYKQKVLKHLKYSVPVSVLVQKVRAIRPRLEDFDQLSLHRADKEVTIDVIVPVYKGIDETLRCIYSVLRHDSETPFELVVINDKSPDVELTGILRHLSARGLFTLIENPVNCGFVKTTNIGMKLHPGRDVVWLNSDTEVYKGWLDRIVECARSDSRIATITPLSNNATICSFPGTLTEGNNLLSFSDAEIDRAASVANAGVAVDTPTGVGFCMYVRREAIKTVGLLDEERFGLGYGEENDLCQRFIKNGYRNVIIPSVFVRHYGATSFGENSLRLQRAMSTLRALHPNYEADVAYWVKQNPLAEARMKLELELLRGRVGHAEFAVSIDQASGGASTEPCYCVSYEKTVGCCTLFLKITEEGNPVLYLDKEVYPNVKFYLESDFDKFALMAGFLKVAYIRIRLSGEIRNRVLSFLHNANLETSLRISPEII